MRLCVASWVGRKQLFLRNSRRGRPSSAEVWQGWGTSSCESVWAGVRWSSYNSYIFLSRTTQLRWLHSLPPTSTLALGFCFPEGIAPGASLSSVCLVLSSFQQLFHIALIFPATPWVHRWVLVSIAILNLIIPHPSAQGAFLTYVFVHLLLSFFPSILPFLSLSLFLPLFLSLFLFIPFSFFLSLDLWWLFPCYLS